MSNTLSLGGIQVPVTALVTYTMRYNEVLVETRAAMSTKV